MDRETLQRTWFPDLGDYDDPPESGDDWERIVAKLWPDGDDVPW